MLKNDGLNFLNVLIIILDARTQYYAGKKINMIQQMGFPQARVFLIKRFTELDGYRALLTVLRGPDIQWLGAETFLIITKALYEVRVINHVFTLTSLIKFFKC